MRGVSEVIAIILIQMITISLAGLAYMFMSTTMSDVTSSAGSTVDTTTSSMMTSFTIESMDSAKIYLRNTGQNVITSLSIYVDDESATFNATMPIAAGAVGTITIYSFIPDGATVKVTSPSGFSTSKVSKPCSKAVGCWDFNEGSGNIAYDSSPYGNDGILTNGPSWTAGRHGNAVQFDGTNDYITNSSALSGIPIGSSTYTIETVIRTNEMGYRGIVGWGQWGTQNLVNALRLDPSGVYNYWWGNDLLASTGSLAGGWHHLVAMHNGTTRAIYLDGVRINQDITSGHNAILVDFRIGCTNTAEYFSGAIDEVRIYNRAIY